MALAALPLAMEALPEVIGAASTALSAAHSVAPYIAKYAPKVKKIPRFFSHLTKSPIQALKSIDIGKALQGAKDVTTDVGRIAAHLESATGHNKYLTAARNLPNLTHEHINKATKLHHSMTGHFSGM